MKVYTKTGDLGETALYGGKRLSKSDIKIESYGTVDELNAAIGVVVALLNEKKMLPDVAQQLITIQSRLFDLGTHLAAQTEKRNLILPDINETHIEQLEIQIDKWEETLPPLKNFILPGGSLIASHTHIARTVCRRAERQAVLLHLQEPVLPVIIKYLNRLSDYLFVLARYLNHTLHTEEILWSAR
jgi:cob(I)alamin adenosyltransferase